MGRWVWRGRDLVGLGFYQIRTLQGRCRPNVAGLPAGVCTTSRTPHRPPVLFFLLACGWPPVRNVFLRLGTYLKNQYIIESHTDMHQGGALPAKLGWARPAHPGHSPTRCCAAGVRHGAGWNRHGLRNPTGAMRRPPATGPMPVLFKAKMVYAKAKARKRVRATASPAASSAEAPRPVSPS